MVMAMLKVGDREQHFVTISACSLSEEIKIAVDGNVVFEGAAPRPPGIAQVEIGGDEKHLLKVVLRDGIVCSIDIYVDGRLRVSY